jgi:hypothetical protein
MGTHDIKDNFIESEVTSVEKPMIDIAMRCYDEYQQALHIKFTPSINKGWYREYEDDIVITFGNIIPPLEDIKSFILGIISEFTPKGLIIGTAWSILPSNGPEYINELYEFILLYIVSNDIHVILVGSDTRLSAHGTISKDGLFFEVAVISAISDYSSPDMKNMVSIYRNTIKLNNNIIYKPVTSSGGRCYGRLYIDHNGLKRYNFSLHHNTRRLSKGPISYINSLIK